MAVLILSRADGAAGQVVHPTGSEGGCEQSPWGRVASQAAVMHGKPTNLPTSIYCYENHRISQ